MRELPLATLCQLHEDNNRTMKRLIIILAILLGLAIPAWIVYKTLIIPSKIKLILPDDTKTVTDSINSIVVRIDENENYFLNEIKTDLSSMHSKIDSLGEIGYNDSTIIIDADKRVMVSRVVEVMNLAKESNRKVILKSNP